MDLSNWLELKNPPGKYGLNSVVIQWSCNDGSSQLSLINDLSMQTVLMLRQNQCLFI